jgi:hypothetical protein
MEVFNQKYWLIGKAVAQVLIDYVKNKECGDKTTTIAQTANVLIQGMEVGQEIYQTVLNAVDTAEQEKQP